MKIAVAIPFYNEETQIEKTLLSYLPLFRKFPSSVFVLVDNNSTDNTIRVVQSFRSGNANVEVVLGYEKRQGVHFARKTALDLSATLKPDIIISTDADTVIRRSAADTLLSELARFGRSRYTVFAGEGSIDFRLYVTRLVYLGEFVGMRRRIWKLYYKLFGPYFFGAFFGLKTEFYRTLVPYYHPERLPGYGEDVMLSHIAFFMGGKFKISAGSPVMTSARRFVGDPLAWITGERLHDFRGTAPGSTGQLLHLTQTYVEKHRHEVLTLIWENTRETAWLFFEETIQFCRENGFHSPRALRAVKNFLTLFKIQSTVARIQNQQGELHRVHREYVKNADGIIRRYLGLNRI